MNWHGDSQDAGNTVPTLSFRDGSNDAAELVSTSVTITDQATLTADTLKSNELVSDEIQSNTFVSKDATLRTMIAEDVSAQHVSVVDLTVPGNNVAEGMVLMATDDTGKCQWGTITLPDEPPALQFPAADAHVAQSIPVFSAPGVLQCSRVVLEGTTLTSSADGSVLLQWLREQSHFGVGNKADRVAVGRDALLESDSSATNLVAVGANALRKCRVSDTVAVGSDAMACLVTGQGNTAVGARTLSENAEGHHCTAMGHSALQNSQGNANTAFGSGALLSARDGGHNTAVGAGSGSEIVHGRGNTVLGDGAGPAGDFNFTVCLGQDARATCHGDLALGSTTAPLKTSSTATSGTLAGLNPSAYLAATINGTPFKVALYDP